MQIDRSEVQRIGRLALLDVSDADAEMLVRELNAIIAFVDQLPRSLASDTRGDIQAMALRDDTVGMSLGIDAVAANAPAWRDGYFVVPRVIDRG